LIAFIYQVRNNFFHGKKSIIEVKHDRLQQKRLSIYTSILLAINGCIITIAIRKGINKDYISISTT